MAKKTIDVSQFQGMAVSLAVKEYWRMPAAYQAWIGVDDCVQKVLLHVHQVINRLGGKKARFDPSQTKLSTYVYHIIQRYFLGFSAHFKKKRLAATIVSIEDMHNFLAADIAKHTITEINEAREKVHRLHSLASPELIEFLDVNLFHRTVSTARMVIPRTRNDVDYEPVWMGQAKRPRKLSQSEIFAKRKEEFLTLARRTGVTYNMYRLALAYEPC